MNLYVTKMSILFVSEKKIYFYFRIIKLKEMKNSQYSDYLSKIVVKLIFSSEI